MSIPTHSPVVAISPSKASPPPLIDDDGYPTPSPSPEWNEEVKQIKEVVTAGTASIEAEEFVNKPGLLVDIYQAIHEKRDKTSLFEKEGKRWVIRRFDLPEGGRAEIEHEEGNKAVKDTLSYCLNLFYPLYDKNVGAPYNLNELALLTGLSHRKRGGLQKPSGYDPKALARFKSRLEGAEKILLTLTDYPLRVKKDTNHNGRIKSEIISLKLSGTYSLVTKVEGENGKVLYEPNRNVLLVAYGQTLDMARIELKDGSIKRLIDKNYIIGKKPLPEQRKALKKATQDILLILEKEAYKLKTGTTQRAIPVKKFRPYIQAVEERDFRKLLKIRLNQAIELDGGDWIFTNQKNGKGQKSKTDFMEYILFNFKTFQPFIEQKRQQKTSK